MIFILSLSTLLNVDNNIKNLNMGDVKRFVVSYGGRFVNKDDGWKWLGNRTTSIVVRHDITYEELVHKLFEKLNVDRMKFRIQLKFTVPNMNIPPADVADDEDLQWFMSVHTEAALCVIADEYNAGEHELHVGVEHLSPIEDALCGRDEVGMCELQEPQTIDNMDESLGEGNLFIRNAIESIDEEDIVENQIFFSKRQLHTRLQLKALKEKFHFKVKKSNPRSLTVCCVDTTCHWLVRASMIKTSEIFTIREYIPEHTYSLDVRRNAQIHATSAIIGHHIMRRLDDANQLYVPAGIIGDMEREFGVRITYNKAWRAKEKGLRFLRGTPEESVQKLPSYCHMLTENNPGTIAHIELDSNNRFLYFFLAFGPSVCGFREYMRPVICVDGSHLKGQYKGTLLLAAAQNANLQIYPLAWSVVDGETNASWYWFFAKLKDVIDDSNQLVFVSDRKKSIKRAITRLFPLSHHGACIWHIEKNLIARYSSSNVIFLFKRAALAYRVSEFDQFMTQIRTIRPSMASYLERAGISTWSRAHFVGNRYNVMTNNIAESLNSVLRRQRSFPITSLIENITSLMQRWFYERKSASTKCSTTVTSKIDDELRKSFDAGATLPVRNLDELVFEVGIATELCTVDLIEYWRAAYNEVPHPVGRESDWVVSQSIRSIEVLPPNIRRAPGRPPTQRQRSRTERSTLRRKCGRCGGSDITGKHTQCGNGYKSNL
ncbi:uncharacterized protein LOC111365876 [Olea europaea var. sylvestris]|uniref:uncharacterized protein LOC111365876 n=1 Tax=Olea europaea var. sylvestris TaxID=158386 RepID=UPI000C1D3714|nr:uncharacterized protein LOC111365876 [Olea europaea var. sylvestris]